MNPLNRTGNKMIVYRFRRIIAAVGLSPVHLGEVINQGIISDPQPRNGGRLSRGEMETILWEAAHWADSVYPIIINTHSGVYITSGVLLAVPRSRTK